MKKRLLLPEWYDDSTHKKTINLVVDNKTIECRPTWSFTVSKEDINYDPYQAHLKEVIQLFNEAYNTNLDYNLFEYRVRELGEGEGLEIIIQEKPLP